MSNVTTTSDFRQVFLIYCLDRQPDGSYVALNRRYKPLGDVRTQWVDYEGLPVRFKFKRALTARQIASLSCNGDTSAERIYLYNDACVPTDGAAAWAAYSARLQALAALAIEH